MELLLVLEKDKPLVRYGPRIPSDIMILRKLLWLHHGHSVVEDNGEMKCLVCRLDFKRDPIQYIAKRFNELALENIIEFMKNEEGTWELK